MASLLNGDVLIEQILEGLEHANMFFVFFFPRHNEGIPNEGIYQGTVRLKVQGRIKEIK